MRLSSYRAKKVNTRPVTPNLVNLAPQITFHTPLKPAAKEDENMPATVSTLRRDETTGLSPQRLSLPTHTVVSLIVHGVLFALVAIVVLILR